jgi:hypothetical protein
MNRKLQGVLFAMLVACCSSGCVTKALITAANGNERERVSGDLYVMSASRVGDNAYICLQRATIDGRGKDYSLIVPTAENRDFYFQDPDDRRPFIKVTPDQLVAGSCKASAETIPVIEVSDQGRLALPGNHREAVYVQYTEGSLRSLGYVSASPLHNHINHRGYAIDFSKSDLVGVEGKKRPYLFLLLPVSVAADVVVGAGVVVYVFAQAAMDDCIKRPGGCKGP